MHECKLGLTGSSQCKLGLSASLLWFSTPTGRGVIFEETFALREGSAGGSGAAAADFPRAISTVPDLDDAPNPIARLRAHPGGGGGGGISTVPDPDDAPGGNSRGGAGGLVRAADADAPKFHSHHVSFRDGGRPEGRTTESDDGGGRSSNGDGNGGGMEAGSRHSREAERSQAALDSVLNPQTAQWERHPEVNLMANFREGF